MNPLRRQKLPPSLRRLLTDISPKEEWTDAEPDTVARDGILLPSRRAASGKEEFLTPARPQAEEATERTVICVLCKREPSCYTCPRCNLNYCGLACYQSPDHSVCTEEFYKESVLDQLKNMGKSDSEGKKKMQEILTGLRQKAGTMEGGMESLLKEAGIVSDDAGEGGKDVTEKVQVVKLLSRLAELQEGEEEGSLTEIEAILRKLEEIGGKQLPGNIDEGSESADGELDLADRLSGLDVDQLSEEELWEILNSKEKETFLNLKKQDALGGLIPLWKPWWVEHSKGRRALVEEVSELERQNSTSVDEQHVDNKTKISQKVTHKQDKMAKKLKFKNTKETSKESSTFATVPPISPKIPKLNSLHTNPSPLICFGLVNALFAYTFTLCLFNGDIDSLIFEFCDMILALSEALNSSKVFNSIHEALDCGETLILGGGYYDKEDPLAPARAVEAVAHIMTGRDRNDGTGYCLAALSQLRSALSQARKALPKEGEEREKRQKYFHANKKCEFFQAWVLDNEGQIHGLAVKLWNEHGKRQRVRNSMEKAKNVVEKNLEKVKGRGNGKLIEELSS